MKHSFKTRLVLSCALLLAIMLLGQILIGVFVIHIPERSAQLISIAAVSGISLLLGLFGIFRVIVPGVAEPLAALLALCCAAKSESRAGELKTAAIDEFEAVAVQFRELQAQLQQQQDTLQKERNLLRSLIDALPDLIYIKDTEHRFVVANAALAKHIGVGTSDELLGKSDIDLMSFKFASRYHEDERELLESGKPLLDRIEPGVEVKTGAKHWFLSTKVPYYDQQGKILGIIGIGRDITRLEQEMEALQELVAGLSWENLFLSEGRDIDEEGLENEEEDV